ncbi:MAG: T9SS type A sorting domain-containing protein, partial [Prolixibacteraceae bacterium]|nr:T9SS type A sorting domain-containing protein [Prolixibacteraceae bacterium]
EENCYVVGNFSSLLISDTISISIENYLNLLFIIKYNKKGETVWVNHFLNQNTSYEDRFKIEAAGITVNEKYRHIYITGLVDEVDHDAGGTHDSKLFVAKCSMEGKGVLEYKEIAKTNAYPKSHYLNYGYGIKNDSSSVYVCGSMKNSSGKSDFYIAKLDTSLDIIWEQQPAQSVASIAYDLTLGEGNNIYATGFFYDSLQMGGQLLKAQGEQEIFVAKYSDNGDLTWAKSAGSATLAYPYDNSWSVSYDNNRSLYLSGVTGENSTFPPGIQTTHQGPFLARMSTDGNFEKVNVFESDYEYDYDFGGGKVACAPDGSYYFTINIEDMKDTIILGSPVIKQRVKNISFSLYPNPAQDEIYFRVKPEQTVISGRVMNLSGQAIFKTGKIKNNRLNTGLLTNGIYFVELTFSDNSKAVGKLVVKKE